MESNRRPKVVRFDQGGEFKSTVKHYLKGQDIHVFYTHNSQIKSNYAERVIKSLKSQIYHYFMENETYRYIDVLQKLVSSYIHAPHESLGYATPASVTKANEDEIRYIQYIVRQKTTNMENKTKVSKRRKPLFKFKIGDFVRISHLKKTIEKGYQEKWTTEHFKISSRFRRDNQNIYELIDLLGDPVKGTFYKYELQKIDEPDNNIYKVDKILKERHVRGRQPEVLIKWMGWPKKFNSWVPKATIKKI